MEKYAYKGLTKGEGESLSGYGNQNIYLNPTDYQLLFDHLLTNTLEPVPEVPFIAYFGTTVISDEDIESGTMLYCTEREFEIYKGLKNDKFLDKDIDILKLTSQLYESEQKREWMTKKWEGMWELDLSPTDITSFKKFLK